MHILPIIPARYESERFPGKLLKPYLDGRPVIDCPIRACAAAFGKCVVLTDNYRIAERTNDDISTAIIMQGDYRNGTERIADACDRLNVADNTLIMHVQGDEVGLKPEDLKRLTQSAQKHFAHVSTLYYKTDDQEALESEHNVKCTREVSGIYSFSRVYREHEFSGIHVGVYCYYREKLREYMSRWPTDDEKQENLEQLRWISGLLAYEVAPCHSINTEEDLER